MNSFKFGFNSGKKKTYTSSSVIESLTDVGKSVGKTLTNDLAQGTVNNAFESIFGFKKPPGNEHYPEPTPDITGESGNTNLYTNPDLLKYQRQEEAGLNEQIAQIRQELVQLTKSMRTLNTQIEKAVHENPVQSGTYYISYFESLKSYLMLIRLHVDESITWLNEFNHRSKKKLGYQGMYKKHGTTFGLSYERKLATSMG